MTAPPAAGTRWGCIVATAGGLIVLTALLCAGVGWMVGTSMSPEQPVQEVASFDPGDDHRALSVAGLYDDPSGLGVVLELEAADGRVLPMLIGLAEADAIQRALDGVTMPRPMTHDLAMRLIEGLDARLLCVTVRKLEDEAFHAALVIERADGTLLQVDSRTSDAVALALRAGAPIYGHEDVLQKVAGP